MFFGEILPSGSIVDLDDVLNVGGRPLPSNREPASANDSLQCITDLVDCCGTESGTLRTERGNWYFPNGTTVGFDSGTRFLVNRGPNEEINGQQFYGSVRLFRRYSDVTERGRFRCELPSAADPSVNLVLYVNICKFVTQLVCTNNNIMFPIISTVNFGFSFDIDHVIFSPSTGSTATTAGERDYSLNCSVALFDPSRLPSNVPMPMFQWSFGDSTSLPSGVTAMPTIMSSMNETSQTYTSTLQFSPLNQSHAGMYTCRLGPGRLENSVVVTVNGKL